MYARTFWKDHIVDGSSVIQQGTNMDQDHFNNEELGIFEAAVANSVNSVYQRLCKDEARNAEIVSVPATLTAGTNNIALPDEAKRKTTAYTVIPVLSAAPGAAVAIAVTAKQANGFTVNASAAATVVFFVQGGML